MAPLRNLVNSKMCITLILGEVFLLSYICSNTINLVTISIFFIISVGWIVFLMSAYAIFDKPLSFIKDFKQYYRPIQFNKQTIFITALLLSELVIAIIVRLLNSNILFVIIVFLIFDFFLQTFIPTLKNPVWDWLYRLDFFAVRIIISYIEYMYIDWVIFVLVLQVIVLILMAMDLDFKCLQAFIPDVLYIMYFYQTLYIYPATIILFCYYLAMYVFE